MSFLEDNINRIDADSTDPKIFWDEFHKLTNLLDSDLTEIKLILDSNDSQLWRRVYCRTLFSYLEGFAYSLEQMFLFFDWFVVDDKTEIKLRNKRIFKKTDETKILVNQYHPINKRLKLVFDSIAKAADTDPLIDDNDSFWIDLSNSIEVRNRIVHPKISDDMTITNSELHSLHKVGFTFIVATSYLFKKRAEAYLDLAATMEKAARDVFGPEE